MTFSLSGVYYTVAHFIFSGGKQWVKRCKINEVLERKISHYLQIYLNVFVTNEKSIHLYEDMGFYTEGKLRKEYKIRGEYVDMFRMSILKEEFSGTKNE